MGGFQAVAAGLGQAGEEAGKGINDALTQALKVRAQQHLEDMDAAHLNLAQKAQTFQQAYETNAQHQAASQFQQSHELAREALIKGGWKDLGSQIDPANGRYFRTMYNDQTQQTTKVYLDGVPPDSPTGMINYYKTLRGMTGDNGKPLFDDMKAKEIAFKMPNLYREGPAGIVQSFIDDAQDQANNGVKSISVPGIGKFDITTPGGRSNYAQATLATIHPGGLYRALNPTTSSGKALDQTGWTGNEMREYNAEANKAKVMENAILKLAEAQMNGILDPTGKQQEALTKNAIDQVTSAYARADQKAEEISARHQTGNNPNTRVPGFVWNGQQWIKGTIALKDKQASVSNGTFKELPGPTTSPQGAGASAGGQ